MLKPTDLEYMLDREVGKYLPRIPILWQRKEKFQELQLEHSKEYDVTGLFEYSEAYGETISNLERWVVDQDQGYLADDILYLEERNIIPSVLQIVNFTSTKKLQDLISSENTKHQALVQQKLALFLNLSLVDGISSKIDEERISQIYDKWNIGLKKNVKAQGESVYTISFNENPLSSLKIPTYETVYQDVNRGSKYAHDFLLGCFLGSLSRIVPNFVNYYSYFECSPPLYDSNGEIFSLCPLSSGDLVPKIPHILMENTQEAVPVKEWLSSLNKKDTPVVLHLFHLVLQVMNALRVAYDAMEYTHYNLDVENILIEKAPKGKHFIVTFYTPNGQEQHIRTGFLARITDYKNSFIRVSAGYSYNRRSRGISFGAPYQEDYTTEKLFPKTGFPVHDEYTFVHSLYSAWHQTNSKKDSREVISFFEVLYGMFGVDLEKQKTPEKILGPLHDFGKNPEETYRKYSKITHEELLGKVLDHKLVKDLYTKALFSGKPHDGDIILDPYLEKPLSRKEIRGIQGQGPPSSLRLFNSSVYNLRRQIKLVKQQYNPENYLLKLDDMEDMMSTLRSAIMLPLFKKGLRKLEIIAQTSTAVVDELSGYSQKELSSDLNTLSHYMGLILTLEIQRKRARYIHYDFLDYDKDKFVHNDHSQVMKYFREENLLDQAVSTIKRIEGHIENYLPQAQQAATEISEMFGNPDLESMAYEYKRYLNTLKEEKQTTKTEQEYVEAVRTHVPTVEVKGYADVDRNIIHPIAVSMEKISNISAIMKQTGRNYTEVYDRNREKTRTTADDGSILTVVDA